MIRASAVAVLGIAAATGLANGLVSATAASPFDGPLSACRLDDQLTPHRRPEDWARTLLDQEYALAEGDVPRDLVPVGAAGIPGTGSVRAFVIDDLAAMAADAREAGAGFRVTSAYRSFAQQTRTFASLAAAYGQDEALRSAARPGHSEHQLGTTVDVEGGEAWLASEAWRYGFVMSYPRAHSPETTCYKAEPWHFRYLGRADARAVERSGVSLRAWLWERQTGG